MFWRINPYFYIQSSYLEVNPTVSVWEQFKEILIFVDENLLGIIFIIFLSIFVIRLIILYFFYNRKTINKYKREKNGNDKKFTTKRCKEDGDDKGRNNVYLINEEGKTYQLLVDYFTLKTLGYGSASRKDELCFSNQEYTIGKRIKIYKIFFDVKDIFKLSNDI
jgi:hypothetical protein